jgi:NADPH-dependent 2,4-dienoyl-CoA reductase/sulfur reductase-like enzyme
MSGSNRVADLGPGDDIVGFEFEGRRMSGRRGESLAAALTAAGERELRIDREGRRRGLFCGMGVCQECLVEIDGRQGQRACMTKLEGSIAVRRQAFLPAAVAALEPPAPGQATSDLEPDVLVLGGGAGGLNAAIAAAGAGARVVLVDERPVPGGQFYKQRLDAPGLARAQPEDGQFSGGRRLIARARAAGAVLMQGAQVWGAFEPLDLMIFDGKGSRLCRPRRLVVAAGAYERGLPVPGWTLPGVMTTGAAQTLLRSYGVLAGRRILVAGNGPLNLQVALELARAGARVLAVAELAPKPGPGTLGPILAMAGSTPDLLLQGWRYTRELARRQVPLLHGHVLAGVEASESGLQARLSPWPQADGAAIRSFEVDAVLMGYGFMPSNEIPRALGCAQVFDSVRGHLVCKRDGDCRTSIPGVYAVGDCAGLGGARAAEAEGIIAGTAAALSLGFKPSAGQMREVQGARRALRRHRRFQAGLWRLFAASRPGMELAEASTAICRCEELTMAEVGAGLAQEPGGLGAFKRATRAGMGRCQGRYCSALLATLTAQQQGRSLDEDGFWAPRPPVKPMAIADIIAPGRS